MAPRTAFEASSRVSRAGSTTAVSQVFWIVTSLYMEMKSTNRYLKGISSFSEVPKYTRHEGKHAKISYSACVDVFLSTLLTWSTSTPVREGGKWEMRRLLSAGAKYSK